MVPQFLHIFFFFTDSCPTQDFPCLETQPLTSSVSMTNPEFNSVEVRIHEKKLKKKIHIFIRFFLDYSAFDPQTLTCIYEEPPHAAGPPPGAFGPPPF